MLSPEVMKQIKHIELKAGHLASEVLAGNYQSAFKGQGMEFDEVREYIPGDDVRSIDWNVTAKTNIPHIKTYREEREMTLMLLIDVSKSQVFGSSERFKIEAAAELAAIIVFLAIRNNDKVGVIIFSDHIEHYIPPKKGRSHVWRVIREILTYRAQGAQTDIGAALDYLTMVQKKKATVFLISDFMADGYQAKLKVAAKRHDLICAHLQDPLECALEDVGVVALEDAESRTQMVVDFSDRQVAESYRSAQQHHHQQLHDFFRRQKIASFPVLNSSSVVEPLVTFMQHRQRRRR